MKKKIFYLLPALALVLASCDSSVDTTSDNLEEEVSNVELAVSALQSLESVAIEGVVTVSGELLYNNEHYSDIDYYEDVKGIWSNEYTWTSVNLYGGYDNNGTHEYALYYQDEILYVNNDGVLANEYLSRQNEVSYSNYYYTTSEEDALYLDAFPHPFLGIDASSLGITFDEATMTLTVRSAFASDFLYTLLSVFAYSVWYGSYLPFSSLQITFDEDYNPLTISGTYSEVYEYGAYTYDEDYEYKGTFVSVSSLEGNVERVSVLEPQEGQDGVGEILSSLAEATSYTATNGNYSIKVVQDEGVLLSYDNDVYEGTFQDDDNYYLIAGTSGNDLVSYQDPIEGDAIEGYFENYTTYGVVPDFNFSQEVFDVVENNDGTISYKLNEYFSGSYAAYLSPVFGNILSNDYTPVNAIYYSTDGDGNTVATDRRLTISEGSNEGSYDFTVYLYNNGNYYSATITISDINSTSLGYSSVSIMKPTNWSDWLSSAYYSYVNSALNAFGGNFSFDDDVPFYFTGSNTLWVLYDVTSSSVNLYASTNNATSVLEAYGALLTDEGWSVVNEASESAVTYTNSDETLEIYLLASTSFIDLYIYPAGGSWSDVITDVSGYESTYTFSPTIAEIEQYFPFFNTYLGWNYNGFNSEDNETYYWIAFSSYISSTSSSYASYYAAEAIQAFYDVFEPLYSAEGWTVTAETYSITIEKEVDGYECTMSVEVWSSGNYYYLGVTFTVEPAESGNNLFLL